MQIDMYLVRHVRHVQRHIHHQMGAILAKAVAMLPRRALVPSWHAAPHRAVHRQRVAHAHRERVTGVTINLQPIHRAHQRIVLNRLPVQRVKQITMVRHRVRHAHRLIRHTHIRTKEQHRRITVMHPRRKLVRKMRVRSQRTVCRTPVAHVPLGLVRIATITMRQIRLVRQMTVHNLCHL